ncbi:MAG: hydrolase [Enterococcus lemanii]
MEGLLLAAGFIGLVIALLSPWTKTGILLALTSFYFYLDVLAIEEWIPFALFTLGILLIIFEFLIPDFGFVGILGGILLFLGLYYTTGNFFWAVRDMSMAIISSATVVIFLIRSQYATSRLSRFVLHTNLDVDNTIVMEENPLELVPGLKGVAQTALRPSGKATFGKKDSPLYDVLSADGFIASGSFIVIEKIEGSKIWVRNLNMEGDY